eukprot:5917686-Prymnesium_polylepis.1
MPRARRALKCSGSDGWMCASGEPAAMYEASSRSSNSAFTRFSSSAVLREQEGADRDGVGDARKSATALQRVHARKARAWTHLAAERPSRPAK